MSYSTISLATDKNSITTLTLNRPDKHNALSAEMISEITDATKKLANDSATRVVILAANGKSFCAGGDLAWMKEQMTASRSQRIFEARKLAEMLFNLNVLPKPLIGNIHGNAFGGGVGLVSVCDTTYCSKNANFALTEVKLGLIPATISPYVSAKIGETNARFAALSARLLSSNTAERIGLITKVVEDLDAVVLEEARGYLALAPAAIAATKALFRSLGPKIDNEVIDQTVERLADTWEHPEAIEGVSAFFENRAPYWKT
ncbi:MAG: crotonase/enoyl-CoA hydratase family protein [Rhodobacteraceae bacterium]|nr:crotonase/enoyl-CoA hydratase family protein [Paracoccaceae bacterium]